MVIALLSQHRTIVTDPLGQYQSCSSPKKEKWPFLKKSAEVVLPALGQAH
jgi:hypothetical protein